MPNQFLAQLTEPSIWEVVEQVPALVVLVVLVSWFLKYLREERDFQKELTDNQEQVIGNMESMLISLSEALGKSIAIMERMEKRINGNGN